MIRQLHVSCPSPIAFLATPIQSNKIGLLTTYHSSSTTNKKGAAYTIARRLLLPFFRVWANRQEHFRQRVFQNMMTMLHRCHPSVSCRRSSITPVDSQSPARRWTTISSTLCYTQMEAGRRIRDIRGSSTSTFPEYHHFDVFS